MRKYHRRSIRLKDYDYSQEGAYFVTICVQNMKCVFGKVINGEMILNDWGHIVASNWLKMAELRDNVELGEWVVMPNHFHGIIIIVNQERSADQDKKVINDRGLACYAHSLGAIVRGFKSGVTKDINEFCQTPGKKLWLRNYYEHIIRDEKDYLRIQEYIKNNPLKWEFDSLRK